LVGGRRVGRWPFHAAPFGRSGHDSTRLIFGAAALGSMSQERADATLATGRRRRHQPHRHRRPDTARRRTGSQPFLATERGRFYLATKTGEREGDKARAQFERSLERHGRRPRRSDPTPQPRRARRVGGRRSRTAVRSRR
jgi:hypothetical protein